MALHRTDGVLTTVFYGGIYGEGERSEENISSLSLAVKRISGGDGGMAYSGKIYCFDEISARRLRCDGDTLDGKKVRQQYITAEGNTYRVRKFRLYENNGVFHHAETEVV